MSIIKIAFSGADVMKILCDKFPKTPLDMATVWSDTNKGAVEVDLPNDMKCIQVLRKQVNLLRNENVGNLSYACMVFTSNLN